MEDKIHEEVGGHELTLEEQHAQLQLEFRHFKQDHSACQGDVDEELVTWKRQFRQTIWHLECALKDRDQLKQNLEIAQQEKILWLAELKKMTKEISKRSRLIDNYEREKDAKKRARKTKAKPTSPNGLRRSG